MSSAEGGSAVFKKLIESIEAWRAARAAGATRPLGGGSGAELISSLLLREETFSDEDESQEAAGSPALVRKRSRAEASEAALAYEDQAKAESAARSSSSAAATASASVLMPVTDTLLAEDIEPPPATADGPPLCTVTTSAQDHPIFRESAVLPLVYSSAVMSHLNAVLSAGEHLKGSMKKVLHIHNIVI